ncbi:MAG: bifunctional serine/threonine-protein kinase/formylglycine-generating enzyme family protein [Lentisphaeria bacterium]|nr:bifunctional serine/threonine-protein kinase/formylglycine-generating enzyme family protein [Lentisphaeria bacterium]
MFKKRPKKTGSPDAPKAVGPEPVEADDTTVSKSLAAMEMGDSVDQIDLQGETTAMAADGLEAALYSRDSAKPPTVSNDHSRYTRFAPLGSGGVGIVDSCFDPNLSRYVALKKLRSDLREKHPETTRFLREARVMAQLEHPHIVPVHEMGVTEEGTPYFSMKKVRGSSLRVILNELRDGDKDLAQEYTPRALLDIFRDIGQAVAFAHSRGIIHRDLKPANVLLGEFGEVLLVDWGLAKLVGSGGDGNDVPAVADLDTPSLDSATDGDITLEGIVSGTPAYMAPEQALGKISELNGQTDVYGLGAVLYEILTYERMIEGETIREALYNVVHTPVIPPRKRAPDHRIPRDLEAICMKAVEKKPDDRYASVKDLLMDLNNYQNDLPISCREGSVIDTAWKWCKRHRFQSTTMAGAAMAFILTITLFFLAGGIRYRGLLEEADLHRVKGNGHYNEMWRTRTELACLQARITAKDKDDEEAALEDRLNQLEYDTRHEYDVAEVLYLRAAARRMSPKIMSGLFEMIENQILYHLLIKDYEEVRGRLDLIRNFQGDTFEAVPSPAREKLLTYDEMAREMSTIRIRVNQPLQACHLITLSPDREKIQATRPLPVTGHVDISGKQGSHVVMATDSHGETVAFPVFTQDFSGQEVTIDIPENIPAGMIFIPSGKFIRGGKASDKFREHARYVDAFLIKKTEVTFGEYIAFWLADDGGAKADHLRSRVRFDSNLMAFIDAWDDQGRLLPQFKMDTPVVGISKTAADSYCQWLSAKVNRDIRLPTDDEWEKAARGVDGRTFPWGTTFEPTVALTHENVAARQVYPLFAPVGSFPRDRSVYGVLDMGGNVREWTSSQFGEGDRFYHIKGGSAILTRRFAAAAYSGDTPAVPSDVGFRYVMPVR